MIEDPSGIANDRAVVKQVDGDAIVLAVGPSRTPLHLTSADLPDEVTPGTWLVLDMQLTPPLVLRIDQQMTSERATSE